MFMLLALFDGVGKVGHAYAHHLSSQLQILTYEARTDTAITEDWGGFLERLMLLLETDANQLLASLPADTNQADKRRYRYSGCQVVLCCISPSHVTTCCAQDCVFM